MEDTPKEKRVGVNKILQRGCSCCFLRLKFGVAEIWSYFMDFEKFAIIFIASRN